jgi:hypothetical protein
VHLNGAAHFTGDACFLCSLEAQTLALAPVAAPLEETARGEPDRGPDCEQRRPGGADAVRRWRVDGRERDAVVQAAGEIPLGRGEPPEFLPDALQVGGRGGLRPLPERSDVGTQIPDLVGERASRRRGLLRRATLGVRDRRDD